VIFASSNAAALAAKPAGIATPIVFCIGADPIKLGLAASMNRPGGNMTGVSFLATALVAKMMEVLHEAVPKASVVAALVNPTNPNGASVREEARGAARVFGLDLHVYNASTEREIDSAFVALVERRAGALIIAGDSFFAGHFDQLVTLAARYSIPAIYPADRRFADAGGLMGYGTSIVDAHRISGGYVGRILKGEKPGDLPVQQSVKVELVINMKTAKALGLNIPPLLRALATDVIE
jgi:putative tryptophan/tyrosine transport system substrate-binding protein